MSTADAATPPSSAIAQAARSSAVVIALGAGTVAAGIVVLVWPEATLKVLAVVFGIFAIVDGVVRMVSALTGDARAAGPRVLPLLLGVLSIVVGVVFVRHPFPTLTALTLVLGTFWVLAGLIHLVQALGDRGPGRSWSIATGALALVSGVLVLAYTSATLVVLVWLLGAQLILGGALLVGWGVEVRKEEGGPSWRHARRSAQA